MDLPEDIINTYEIIDRIGGRVSNLYLAESIENRDLYIVKELIIPYYSENPKIQKIIEEIIDTGERFLFLEHPQIPKFIKFVPLEGRYYFVMEYIEGMNMDIIVDKAEDFLPYKKVVEWAIKLCDALMYLHSRHIIFKDLKPEHIILDKNDNVKLVDFGLSKYPTINVKSLKFFPDLTPYFSSPEQCQKKNLLFASDIYSLGATLYFLLTECFPVDANERLKNKVKLEYPSLLNRNIPEDLDYIIMKSMELNPENRYPTIDGMKLDLEALLEGRALLRDTDSLSDQEIHEKVPRGDLDEFDYQVIKEVTKWANPKQRFRHKESEQDNNLKKKQGYLRPRSALFQLSGEKEDGNIEGEKSSFRSPSTMSPSDRSDELSSPYPRPRSGRVNTDEFIPPRSSYIPGRDSIEEKPPAKRPRSSSLGFLQRDPLPLNEEEFTPPLPPGTSRKDEGFPSPSPDVLQREKLISRIDEEFSEKRKYSSYHSGLSEDEDPGAARQKSRRSSSGTLKRDELLSRIGDDFSKNTAYDAQIIDRERDISGEKRNSPYFQGERDISFKGKAEEEPVRHFPLEEEEYPTGHSLHHRDSQENEEFLSLIFGEGEKGQEKVPPVDFLEKDDEEQYEEEKTSHLSDSDFFRKKKVFDARKETEPFFHDSFPVSSPGNFKEETVGRDNYPHSPYGESFQDHFRKLTEKKSFQDTDKFKRDDSYVQSQFSGNLKRKSPENRANNTPLSTRMLKRDETDEIEDEEPPSQFSGALKRKSSSNLENNSPLSTRMLKRDETDEIEDEDYPSKFAGNLKRRSPGTSENNSPLSTRMLKRDESEELEDTEPFALSEPFRERSVKRDKINSERYSSEEKMFPDSSYGGRDNILENPDKEEEEQLFPVMDLLESNQAEDIEIDIEPKKSHFDREELPCPIEPEKQIPDLKGLSPAEDPESARRSSRTLVIAINAIVFIIIIVGFYFFPGRQLLADFYLTRGKDLVITGGDPAKAITEIERSKEFKEETFEYNFYLARAYKELYGNDEAQEKAIELFNKALEFERNNVKIYEMLAEIYIKNENYKSALPQYKKLLEITPDDKKLYLKLAELSGKTGEYENALEYYNKYISYEDKDYKIHMTMADLYYLSGNPGEAIKEIEKATVFMVNESEVKPEELAGAFIRTGDLYFAEKEYSSSLSNYMRGFIFNPEVRPEPGNLDVMKKYFQKLLKEKPQDVGSVMSAGNIFFIEGDMKNAIKQYDNVLKFPDTGGEEIYFYIALAYYSAGDNDKAQNYFQSYLNSYPQGLFSAYARNTLDIIKK